MFNKFQERSFLFVAFLLGCATIYGNVVCFVMLALLLFNIKSDVPFFLKSIKQEKYYLSVPAFFLIYMFCHTIVMHFIVGNDMKASYGIFETILLFFITIPLYMLSMKKWMTPRLLQNGLLFFCLGVLLFNMAALFQLTGKGLFTDTLATLDFVFQGRFGGNKSSIFGGFMMLEPQAMILGLASVMAFFLALVHSRSWGYWILTFFLVIFLSFTVTKAAILGFLAGGLIGGVYIFRKFGWKGKRNMLTVLLLLVIAGIFGMPQGYVDRFHAASTEISNIKEGQFEGGSIAPRVAMWKEIGHHADEFAWCGVGVYYKDVVKKWFDDSAYQLAGTPNAHNSFLEYWIKGGIPGLFLLGSLFLFPLVRMFRRHRLSLWILAGMAVIFITSNTCVLFVHVNSLSIVLFLLSMYYFYSDDFWNTEIHINE